MSAHLREAWRARIALSAGKLYHAAPVEARDDIAIHGLDWRRSPRANEPHDPRSKAPVAIYFYRDRAEADDMMADGMVADLYEVDDQGLHLTPDPYQPESAVYTLDPVPPERVKLVRTAGILAATQTITLYHGTNQAALDGIRQAGEFRPLDPHALANRLEDHYHLPRDSVWNSPFYEFDRHREGDQNIYVSGSRETARHYAEVGSEPVDDALSAVWEVLFDVWGPGVKYERDFKPEFKDGTHRANWKAQERQRWFRPVVLTLAVPLDVVARNQIDYRGRGAPTPEAFQQLWDEHGGEQWTTMMLKGPLPASYITRVETL